MAGPEAERSERQAGGGGPSQGGSPESTGLNASPAPLPPESAANNLRNALQVVYALRLDKGIPLHAIKDLSGVQRRIETALDQIEQTVNLATGGNRAGVIRAVLEKL